MNISVKIISRQNLGLLLASLCLVGGFATEAAAQRDPFAKPIVRSSAPKKPASTTEKKSPIAIGVPSIQQRIDSYKAIRMACAERGIACPKPTSVLTVDEMQVTGIFRTPRGYAAMVEATPIKLSYTIYPGEKFYDGQLVAIEEAKLIFRRTRKMSDGKEISAVDTKVLRQAGVNELAGTRTEQSDPTIAIANTSAPTQGLSAEAVSAEDKTSAPPAAETKPSSAETVKTETDKQAAAPPTAPEADAKPKTAKKPSAKPKTKSKNKPASKE